MTNKQIQFCEQYLIDSNGTRAAIAAGYSERSASVIAAENLEKPQIQEYLQDKRLQIAEKAGVVVTKERVLLELFRIAFIDTRRLYNEDGSFKKMSELDDDMAAALGGIETHEINIEGMKIGEIKKVKLWDKNKALEMLGKYFGIFEKDNEQARPVVNLLQTPVIFR